MEKKGQRDRVIRGVNHRGDVCSGVEHLGAALEIIIYSVIFSHVAWHIESYWTNRVRRRDKKGDKHFQSLGRCLRYLWSVIHVRSL